MLDLTATAGTAIAEAVVDFMGYGDPIEGVPSSTDYYSAADAEANAEVAAIGAEPYGDFDEIGFDEFIGDFVADVDLRADGGYAEAISDQTVEASADADAYVLDFDENGIIVGNIGSADSLMELDANGGDSRALVEEVSMLEFDGEPYAVASASAVARVVDDAASLEGDVLGEFNVEADGGENGVHVRSEPSADAAGLSMRGNGWLRSVLSIWL